MTLEKICQSLPDLRAVTSINNRDFNQLYFGDLMSHAMTYLGENDIWLTVTNHINAVAIGARNGAAGIILCHGESWNVNALQAGKEHRVSLLTTSLSVTDIARKIMALEEKDS